jgi:hypothetical protein
MPYVDDTLSIYRMLTFAVPNAVTTAQAQQAAAQIPLPPLALQ